MLLRSGSHGNALLLPLVLIVTFLTGHARSKQYFKEPNSEEIAISASLQFNTELQSCLLRSMFHWLTLLELIILFIKSGFGLKALHLVVKDSICAK